MPIEVRRIHRFLHGLWRSFTLRFGVEVGSELAMALPSRACIHVPMVVRLITLRGKAILTTQLRLTACGRRMPTFLA